MRGPLLALLGVAPLKTAGAIAVASVTIGGAALGAWRAPQPAATVIAPPPQQSVQASPVTAPVRMASPAAQPPPPFLRGAIAELRDGALVLRDAGSREHVVMLRPGVTVRLGRENAGPEALREGEEVAVAGRMIERDGKREFAARLILVRPPDAGSGPQRRPFPGAPRFDTPLRPDSAQPTARCVMPMALAGLASNGPFHSLVSRAGRDWVRRLAPFQARLAVRAQGQRVRLHVHSSLDAGVTPPPAAAPYLPHWRGGGSSTSRAAALLSSSRAIA